MTPNYIPQQVAQDEPAPFSYPNPYSNEMSEGSLRFQLSSEDLIEDIKYTFLGYKKSTDRLGKDVWIKEDGTTGIINEKGMNYIENYLRSRLTKIFKLTSLSEEHIIAMTLNCHKTVWDNMYEHYEEYGIDSITNIKTIADTVTDTIFATLSSAKNGEFLIFLKTTHRIHETQTLTQQQRPNSQPQAPNALQRLPIIGGMFK